VKLTIESTSTIVTINGNVQARVWQGKTEGGVPVELLVTRIAVPNSAPEEQERFARELREQPAPKAAEAVWPLRMIL
jgi:hypothetical protein